MANDKRIGVLISGRGSNLKSLIDACARPNFPAQIVVVISNRPGAPGLDFARNADIDQVVIDHTAFDTREEFETALNQALETARVELICNAGFMRLLTDGFVQKWLNRQLNIHPSLLPAYKGLHTHERAIADGVKLTGCTVHLVRTEMDSGPIIAQAAVPVRPDDTADTLAARVLAVEHKLYPLALRLVAQGKVRVSGERLIFDKADAVEQVLFNPPV
jgi:phosphoribosylglycinamide formyltransferase-1